MKEEIHTLYIFGGLPGTGKSTLASALASELRAPYLRVDVVEAWRNVAESLGIPFVEIKKWSVRTNVHTSIELRLVQRIFPALPCPLGVR
ncbi:AAA family ATPase [Paenibacillus rhizoplanae]